MCFSPAVSFERFYVGNSGGKRERIARDMSEGGEVGEGRGREREIQEKSHRTRFASLLL